MCCRSLVTVILGALMMFLTSWKLALLTCATLPFMLLQFRAFAREWPNVQREGNGGARFKGVSWP